MRKSTLKTMQYASRIVLKKLFDRYLHLHSSIIPRIDKRKVKSVLVINLQGIGDLIMMTPLIEDLKQGYKCKIDLVCMKKNAGVFKHDTLVNIITYEGMRKTSAKIRNRTYDVAICPYRAQHAGYIVLHSRSAMKIGYIHSLELWSNVGNISKHKKLLTHNPRERYEMIAQALDIRNHDYQDAYVVIKKDDQKVAREFLEKTDGKIFVLCAQNAWSSRRWPAQRWIELAKKILDSDNKCRIVIIGSEHDAIANNSISKSIGSKRVIDASGKLDIQQTIALLKEADVMITTDCGPMHMGFAARTKVVSLFGATNPNEYVPRRYLKWTIWKNREEKFGKLYNHNNEPLIGDECMRAITTKDVLRKIREDVK